MRYEHLVQINDPANPHIVPLSRAQVWAGLMQRVHAPQRFPVGPQGASVLAGDRENVLHRVVDFGTLTIRDTVHLQPQRHLRFVPERRDDMVPVTLSIALETPPALDDAALFLRFIYECDVDDPDTDGYRQQAWLANDVDMVRTIRQWQEEGLI